MNSEEQQAHWDLKYEQGLTSLTEPDPFFISAFEAFVDQSFPHGGVALDLAGGLGRSVSPGTPGTRSGRHRVCRKEARKIATSTRPGHTPRGMRVPVTI